jgi:type IV fimbrial biogenesis protein FimT
VLRPAQKGVSLIETLVALVIVSVLLVAGAPSFASFMQNRKIRNAAEAVHSGLSFAKAEAVRRNTIVTFKLAANGGWILDCQNCPDAKDMPTMSAAEISPDIAVTALDIGFNGFGRALPPVAGIDTTIYISNSKGLCEVKNGTGTMRCLQIIVTPGGQIRSCDPRLTETNPSSPQACPKLP